MSDEQSKVERLRTVANSIQQLVDFLAVKSGQGELDFLSVICVAKDETAFYATSGLEGLSGVGTVAAMGMTCRLQLILNGWLSEVESDGSVDDETEEAEDEDAEDNVVSFVGKKDNGKAV